MKLIDYHCYLFNSKTNNLLCVCITAADSSALDVIYAIAVMCTTEIKAAYVYVQTYIGVNIHTYKHQYVRTYIRTYKIHTYVHIIHIVYIHTYNHTT